MTAELAEALHAVHDAGIVHRDIKPSNVMLAPSPLPGRQCRPKLADFGIAYLLDSTRLTTPGMLIGTVAYIAPEQVRGQQPAPPADIYALGLVVLEAITGQRAYPNAAGHEAIAMRLTVAPTVPDSLDPGWKRLLTAMTATDPALRPTSLEVAVAASALIAPPGATGLTAVLPVTDQPTEALPAAAVLGAAAGGAALGAAAAGAAAAGAAAATPPPSRQAAFTPPPVPTSPPAAAAAGSRGGRRLRHSPAEVPPATRTRGRRRRGTRTDRRARHRLVRCSARPRRGSVADPVTDPVGVESPSHRARLGPVTERGHDAAGRQRERQQRPRQRQRRRERRQRRQRRQGRRKRQRQGQGRLSAMRAEPGSERRPGRAPSVRTQVIASALEELLER